MGSNLLYTVFGLTCATVGYAFGWLFRGLAEMKHIDTVITKPVKTSSLSKESNHDSNTGVTDNIETEFEQAIMDWVCGEFQDYNVFIVENRDDPGIRLVSIYDVDGSKTTAVTKRLWEIIQVCADDYNMDRRMHATYIPSVHNHVNTERFFPQYLRNRG